MAEVSAPYSAEEVRVKIGGQAGFGIKASGQILARAFVSAGLNTFDLTEYPSLIRGGHNVFGVRVSPEPVPSHVGPVDVLVALNQETIDLHLGELADGAAVVFDPDKAEAPDGVRGVPVPLDEFAEEAGGKIMRNTVALGAVLALLDFPMGPLEDSIVRQFSKKKPEIAAGNIAAARRGYEHAKEQAPEPVRRLAPIEGAPRQLLVDGNSAVGLGALAAGIGFYAAYPMTPATSLLHFMAAHERDEGVVVKHTEDELAAMNMVVGAAFTGARAMCGTSGGGFALMTEAFGLAGVAESAVVVMVSQRPGPATGLPTWTEQADLRMVVHAAQGEFPRVVLAPGDHTQCFDFAWRAFDLADALQTPVVLMLDNFLSENRASVPPFDAGGVSVDRGDMVVEGDVGEGYLRYRITDSGVSTRALPGVRGALQLANSYDHDEYGFANEEPAMRDAQEEKRMRKLDLARKLVPSPIVEGPDDAAVGLIVWGSTVMPARQALAWLDAEGVPTRMLQVTTLAPFPADVVTEFIEDTPRTLVVEGNFTGQLESLVREHCLLEVDDSLRRYDGRPPAPEDILHRAKEVAARA
jgi:2-oxoglutarate ferredoxin oxidoreductase subunit alpha